MNLRKIEYNENPIPPTIHPNVFSNEVRCIEPCIMEYSSEITTTVGKIYHVHDRRDSGDRWIEPQFMISNDNGECHWFNYNSDFFEHYS